MNQFAQGVLRPVAAVTALLMLLAVPVFAGQSQQADATWPGFRGPRADGAALVSGLADSDALSLEIAWRKPIGSGYSGVSVSGDLAVTMFVDGDDDVMAAFDPDSGDELWRFAVGPTYIGHDGSFDGPMSTPLLVGNLVIGLSGYGRMFAVDRIGGEPVWSTDLVEDHGAVPPEYGFATSPMLHDGVLVTQIGAPDGSIAGFDPLTGQLLWKLGTDVVAYQSPVSMTVDGRDQVVAAGMTELVGIDAARGEVLWRQEHGGDGYLGAQSLVPVGAGDDRVFLAFKDESSTVLHVGSPSAAGASVWENRNIRNSYAVAVYHDGFVYGFSSRFLTAVDAATGDAAWKSRPPGDGFPIVVDDMLVILTKDGSLHLVEATPEEYRERASIQVFDDLAWVHPSYAMGSVFVRSTGAIARVDIRRGTRMADAVEYVAGRAPEDSDFAAFLARVDASTDKPAEIDAYLAGKEFPLIEGDGLAHFVYRGEGEDLAVAGDMIGSRQDARMHHVDGTDLFYFSVPLLADARVNYRFIRDYEEILDPRNPLQTVSDVHGADMAIAGGPDEGSEMSWMAMPAWSEPAHLREPAADAPRGELVDQPFDSAILGEPMSLQVYLPPGYEAGDQRYPVVYYHVGFMAPSAGRVPLSLDNLIGDGMDPVIAVFVNVPPDDAPAPVQYSRVFGEEVVPLIDANFRTFASAAERANVGAGWGAFPALYATFDNPGLVGKVAVQSLFMLDLMRIPLEEKITTAAEQPLDVYIEWGAYDLQNPQENWDARDFTRDFAQYLRDRGYTVDGGEVHDSTGYDSWRNRNDVVLRAMGSR